MKAPWILPVAALVVGAAGGFISGKNTAPEGAASKEEAAAQPARSKRSEVASATGTTKKSRAESVGQIVRLPGNSNRIQAMLDLYGNMTPDQLAAEAAKLEALPMSERMMASFMLFGRWAEVDPTAAMAYTNTMGMAGGFVRPTILQSWASTDPAGAARYYSENPREFAMMGMMGGGRGGQGGAAIIASEWARQDPAGAMAWAASLTTEKGAAMDSVIGEIAKTDPKKAGDMISQMDPDDRAGAYRAVASQYGALNFTEAQSWIRTLPADQQAAALGSAIRGLSNSDPAAAGKQFALMEAGEAKDRVLDTIVGNLARKDPAAAGELLKQQSNDESRGDGMRELMPAWTQKDPVAALAYAQSFPQGNVRDNALQSYVMSYNSGSPAELVKVAATIGDEGDRNRSIGIVASRWMREDEPAAKAYIEASPDLSEEAKKRITEGRGMWGGGGRRGRGGNGNGGNGN